MIQARQTATKLWISDMCTAKFVKSQEEFAPSVIVINNRNIGRINIIGTIVEIYEKEDGSFSSIIVDDGSGQIAVRAFKEDVKILEGVSVGKTVNVIGKPREYDGEVYMLPEIVSELPNHNWEILRKLELLCEYGTPNIIKKKEQ